MRFIFALSALLIPLSLSAQTPSTDKEQIPAVLAHGANAEDPYRHIQTPPQSWSHYQIIPHIIGDGAYGDDAGTAPGDPVPLIVNNQDALDYAPRSFTGRPDMPISDKALALLNTQIQNERESNQNQVPDETQKYYAK